jgi:hypothetical protein
MFRKKICSEGKGTAVRGEEHGERVRRKKAEFLRERGSQTTKKLCSEKSCHGRAKE